MRQGLPISSDVEEKGSPAISRSGDNPRFLWPSGRTLQPACRPTALRGRPSSSTHLGENRSPVAFRGGKACTTRCTRSGCRNARHHTEREPSFMNGPPTVILPPKTEVELWLGGRWGTGGEALLREAN